MTIDLKQIECPNCSEIIEISYKNSQYIRSHKTDLSCVGACTPTPFNHSCGHCKYVFFDEKVKLDIASLNSYVKSKEYLDLYKKYSDSKPFFIIYNIYKNQVKSQDMINQLLLFNYYHTKEMDDFKLLIDNYSAFLELYNDNAKDKTYLFINMLIGEYYRRKGKFDEAKTIFNQILNINVDFENNFVDMCKFQLKLIAQENTQLENYYNSEPDYSFRISALDDKDIEKTEKDDDDVIFNFIFELHKARRYSEFRNGLDKLKNIGVDLNNAFLISSILYLLTRAGGVSAKNEILEMVRVSIFEYNVLDIDYDENGTLISWMKIGLFYDYRIVLEQEFIDTVREYYFEYIIQRFDKNKIKSLSAFDQHVLLLNQLPYYARVNHLLTLGFKFDKDFIYNSSIYYENLPSYIMDISFSRTYGDFFYIEDSKLYESLSLFLDNIMKEDINKIVLFHSIHQLKNKLSNAELQSLIKKLNVNYSEEESLRYSAYGESSDWSILSDFLDDFFNAKFRYDDFRNELEKLINMGVDLHPSTQNKSNLLHKFLFYMQAYNDTYSLDSKNDIFKIILFEYNVDPSCAIFKEGKFNGTILDIHSLECTQEEFIKIAEKIREIIFEYSIKLFDAGKLNSLSSVQQHNLLLIQMPYFDKVQKLIELGFKFDKFNAIKYLWEYRISKSDKKYTKLYELIDLIIDNSEYKNKDKMVKDIENFRNELSKENINSLIEKVKAKKD